MMKVVASTKCKLGKMNELTTYIHITEFKKKNHNFLIGTSYVAI